MEENLSRFLQVDEAKLISDEVISTEQVVTLKLPPDLAQILLQRSGQVGQSQAEVIVSLLRAALGQTSTASPLGAATSTSEYLSTQQELHLLKARLGHLESLIPRLELLEGKWLAF